MRLGSFSRRCSLYALLIALAIQQAIPLSRAQAATNFVFLARNALKGAGTTAAGVRPLSLNNNASLLGTNGTLGISVQDVVCTPQGVHPTISLVVIDPQTKAIIAPIMQFQEIARVYARDDEILIQAQGISQDALEGGAVDALISFSFQACTATNDMPTVPTSVTIQPLGTIKPRGTPSINAPITADQVVILLNTDDPDNPVLQVNASGIGTTPSPACDINLSATSLNFSNVPVGTSSILSLIVRNNGNVACTVNALDLNGGSGFSLTNPATPFTVPALGSVSIPVKFEPVGVGADSAVLSVSSTTPSNAIQYVTLSGNGTTNTPAILTASPLLLDFGQVQVAPGNSKSLSVTITNSGGAPGDVNNLTLVTESPDFTLIPSNLTTTITNGTSAVVSVVYTPSDTTAAKGTLEINTSDPAHHLILVSLNATGITATCSLVFTPTTLNFGTVVVGTNSDLSMDITNNSLATCTINSVTNLSDGQFTLNPPVSTPFDIAPGTVTNLVFEFTPTGGPATNQIQFSTTSGTTTITLTGLGAAASSSCSNVADGLDLIGSELDFGVVPIVSTNILKFRVTNISVTNCSITGLLLTGSPSFTTIAPPLPINLMPSGVVEIGVQYLPPSPGTDSGLLQVINGDPSNPLVIPITLNGVAEQPTVRVSTNLLDFGSQPVASSSTQMATITNTNGVNATIRSISLSGSTDFILSPLVPTGQFLLQSGHQVDLPVTFVPSSQGTKGGLITIQSDAVGAPFTITLTGVGLACNLAVAPSFLSFGTAQQNLTNNLSFSVFNSGNSTCSVNSVDFLGSGRFFITSPAFPFPVPPGASVPVTVEYLPANIDTILILGGTVRTSGNPTIIP